MIRAKVLDDNCGRPHIDTNVTEFDDYVEIPPKLFESYLSASRQLYNMEKIISSIPRKRP